MSNTIKPPKIITHPNPVNIDRRIQTLQQAFADGLPWLQIALGRAWKAFRKVAGEDAKAAYAYPAVYVGKKEYFNALPGDTYKSYCYFYVRDKSEPATDLDKVDSDYQPGTWNEWRQRVDIVFWFNCAKTMPGIDYPIVENMLADVRQVLRSYSFFTPTGVLYDPDTVFEPFSLDALDEQELMYPYGGFRIEGVMQYLEQDNINPCVTY